MSKDYKTIIKNMINYFEDESIPESSRLEVRDWYAEFGELNHDYCKKILKLLSDKKNFDNIQNEKIIKKIPQNLIKEIGEKIYKRGGFKALQSNYYTMMNFMTTEKNLRDEIKCVETYWDGVGTWKA